LKSEIKTIATRFLIVSIQSDLLNICAKFVKYLFDNAFSIPVQFINLN